VDRVAVPQIAQAMKNNLRRLIWALLLGVALYGAFVLYAGYREIDASLHTFRWSAFAAALGLATLNYLLRFLKWEYYLARLGIRGVEKLDSLLVFLSGFVLTVTPGKVGEVFKSAVLAQTHGVPAARTARRRNGCGGDRPRADPLGQAPGHADPLARAAPRQTG
jgi:hypothetical protein